MKLRLKINSGIFLPAYAKLYDCRKRYLVLFGGAGSGKSTFAAQKIILRTITEKSHRFLLLRKVQATIRKSQFQLITDIISKWGIKHLFELRLSDLEIVFRPNGNRIITAGLDNPEKLKSIQGVTGAWIEEATELNKEDFLQADLRIRGITDNYKQIILSFNPADTDHWLYERFFEKSDKQSEVIKTTYRDNPCLDAEYVKLLSNLAAEDALFGTIYAEGNWGRKQNLVYAPLPVVEKIPNNPNEVFYALDFGFNNPAALLKFTEKDGVYYLEEMIYEPGLTTEDIADRMSELIGNINDVIYADPEEAGGIETLRRRGFNVHRAKKDILPGIDAVKSLIARNKIFSLKKNINLHAEIKSYRYKTDMAGKILEEPFKYHDHLMDCLRYGVYSRMHYQNNSTNILIFKKRRLAL